MPKCCVTSCKATTCRSKVKFFSLEPVERLLLQESLGIEAPLTQDARICQEHFHESDFVKGAVTVIDGEDSLQLLPGVTTRPGALQTFCLSKFSQVSYVFNVLMFSLLARTNPFLVGIGANQQPAGGLLNEDVDPNDVNPPTVTYSCLTERRRLAASNESLG